MTHCVAEDRDPIIDMAFGRHVTEMMIGAIQASETGQRYEMTTSI